MDVSLRNSTNAGRLVNYLTRRNMYVADQIEELYKQKYDDYVRMYKTRAGVNDVEDLVQEAFYRALYYAENQPILIFPHKTFCRHT